MSCLVESRVYLNLNLIINYVFSILYCPTAPPGQPEAQGAILRSEIFSELISYSL